MKSFTARSPRTNKLLDRFRKTEVSMNAVAEKHFTDAASDRHPDWLESEAIHIMREVAAECTNPALLFSGGKDSIVLLRIAEKASVPVNFPISACRYWLQLSRGDRLRDKTRGRTGERLIVGSVED